MSNCASANNADQSVEGAAWSEVSAARCCGTTSSLINRPMPAADIEYTFANIDRAAELLGYAPTVTVEQGVREFWAWYRESVMEVSGA